MWEQYKKTVVGIQVTIASISGLSWYWTGHWQAAAVYFAAMQVAAVCGAAWGYRLRNKILRAGTVPTRQM